MLDLWYNHIDDQGVRYLSIALEKNKVENHRFIHIEKYFRYYEIQTLTTLQLDQNNIGAEGAQHLANALRKNRVGE